MPNKKILLGEYPIVNIEMLQEHGYAVTENPKDADFFLHFSTESYGKSYVEPDATPPYSRKKSIMFQVEPPLAGYRQRVYETAFLDQLHTVYNFNPMRTPAENQFPVTRCPEAFPYLPIATGTTRRHRQDTTLGKRTFYYAGDRYQQWGAPHFSGTTNLYPLRGELVQYLRQQGLAHFVTGPGWEHSTRSSENWRELKLEEIDECQADFVLCLENCRCPGYISEKIHDGFNSDRVVLYCGEPNITDRIPHDCFINLGGLPFYREIVGPDPYVFNQELVKDLILNMPQEVYDRILNNARVFRDQELTMTAYQEEQDRLTKHLLSRLSSD